MIAKDADETIEKMIRHDYHNGYDIRLTVPD